MYKVPTTTIEALERKISSYLQRWLGLGTCSPSSAALYGTSNVLQLLISSLIEEFMVARTRDVWQDGESRDPKVAAAGIQVRTGRKLRKNVGSGRVTTDAQGVGGAHSNRVCRLLGCLATSRL